VQRLADVVDCAAGTGARVRIVHVGGAGLTLPRYICATRPHSAQVVFEPDAELTEFVRHHLPLPPRSGIKIRATDGRAGISELRDAYAEFLVVDAFVGARVPADLTTAEFFGQGRRVLTDDGLILVNLTDRGPFDYARRALAGLTATFPYAAFCAEPATLKGRRFGNVILLGSGAPLPLARLAERAGRSPFPYRVLHGARLTQLMAGGRPFTDTDSAESPPPPGGLSHFS